MSTYAAITTARDVLLVWWRHDFAVAVYVGKLSIIRGALTVLSSNYYTIAIYLYEYEAILGYSDNQV